jgi:hypothetical protein
MRFASGCACVAALIAAAGIDAKAQILAPPAAKAAPSSKPEDKPDPGVEQLIKDLGSEDYRAREKAGRDLIAKGEKILPNLRAALASTDNPEVHRRLLVMVRKIDYDRLVAPKLITLSLKNKTVKEVLAEITRQTGYKIEYAGGEGPGGSGSTATKHDFELNNVPFWQAMDKVASTAGCDVANDNGDETLRVYIQEDSANPYVSYAGPFRFVASNINSNINVQLAGVNRRGGGAMRQEFMNLNFEIQSEPKNPMLGITQVDLISAVDENGGTLIPPRDQNFRQNFYNNGMMRGHSTYGNVGLSRRDKTATTIKELKAKVGVILLSGTTPEITVSDPLKVTNKSFTGRTVEIEFGSFTEVANNKGRYQLELTAKKLGRTEVNQFNQFNQNEDFNWSNSFWQKVEVLDSAGNRYHSMGPSGIDNNGASVTLTIPFGPEDRRTGKTAKLGPPVKVLINEWLTVVNEVTFEFKGIPLP